MHGIKDTLKINLESAGISKTYKINFEGIINIIQKQSKILHNKSIEKWAKSIHLSSIVKVVQDQD